MPVSPHIFSEQSLSLAGSPGHGDDLEHVPWFAALYRERMELVDGRIRMPEGPGIGFTFDPVAVERYRVRWLAENLEQGRAPAFELRYSYAKA